MERPVNTRTRISAALAATVAIALLGAGSGSGSSSTPITTCGQTVTTNAVLAQNLFCTGTGVIVGAAGITVDLHGFRIRGDRSGGHYGVDDGLAYDHVTVKNGDLIDFSYGVFAFGDHVSISGLVVSGSPGYGIDVTGDQASIKSSTSSGNSGFGIFLDGAAPSVTSSVAAGNGYAGIQAYGDSASIKSSTASGNGGGGIAVVGNAARLKGNTANGNGFAGSASDGIGRGIDVSGYTTAPLGANVARANDDPIGCSPGSLC
jgi:parallel beta-helix repeat protein